MEKKTMEKNSKIETLQHKEKNLRKILIYNSNRFFKADNFKFS